MKCLIIDDNQLKSEKIVSKLKQSGLTCETIKSTREAQDLIDLYHYDTMIICDRGSSLSNSIIQKVSQRNVHLPIIFITEQAELNYRLDALRFGADDVMLFPVVWEELVERIRVIIRRNHGQPTSLIHVSDLTIDLSQRSIESKTERTYFSNKEFALLEVLALRKGKVVSKEHLLSYLYASVQEPEVKIIDVFICKIRKKLAKLSANPTIIRTVWGLGYMLQDDTSYREHPQKQHPAITETAITATQQNAS